MVSLTDNVLINKLINNLKQRLKPAAPRHFVAIDFDSRFVRIVHARRTGKTTRI